MWEQCGMFKIQTLKKVQNKVSQKGEHAFFLKLLKSQSVVCQNESLKKI